jgi:hypothetical protein
LSFSRACDDDFCIKIASGGYEKTIETSIYDESPNKFHCKNIIENGSML